jgi:hypothetical protein
MTARPAGMHRRPQIVIDFLLLSSQKEQILTLFPLLMPLPLSKIDNFFMHTYVFEHALSNGAGFKKINIHHVGSKSALLGLPGPTGSPLSIYPKPK